MIGSETFIMVAFRCSENSTPCAFASSIWRATNAASALRDMRAPSTISPACTFSESFSTFVLPSLPWKVIDRTSPAGIVADRSLP